MKVLSMLQPWASLVAVGAMKIETRSWATKHRGVLAIHASKGWDSEQRTLLATKEFQTGLAPLVGKPLDFSRLDYYGVKEDLLPRGFIIATCNLVDCLPTTVLAEEQLGKELPYGDFTPGRFAWFLEDVKLLPEPIPAKGMLGLWEYNL